MNINFKAGYFNFNFFNQIRWTLSMDSLDFAQSIRGHCPDCPLSPW